MQPKGPGSNRISILPPKYSISIILKQAFIPAGKTGREGRKGMSAEARKMRDNLDLHPLKVHDTAVLTDSWSVGSE